MFLQEKCKLSGSNKANLKCLMQVYTQPSSQQMSTMMSSTIPHQRTGDTVIICTGVSLLFFAKELKIIGLKKVSLI